MGRSRHGAQLAVIQPSFRHRGFDSSPTHEQQCASRLTGRAPALTPEKTGFEARSLGTRVARRAARAGGPNCVLPGRAVRGAARRRSPMERAPAYEAGGCRFDPCRRRHLAVAQWREHRPPKAVVARSTRAGEATEATRLDEEPVPKTGTGLTTPGRSSRPASALAAIVKWS